jgi:hypothetical protein
MIPCDVLYQDEEAYISSFDKRLDESHVRTGPIFRFLMVDNAHYIFHTFNDYSITLTRYISIFLTYWLRFCHASLFSTPRPLPSVALSNVRASMADVQRIHNHLSHFTRSIHLHDIRIPHLHRHRWSSRHFGLACHVHRDTLESQQQTTEPDFGDFATI